MTQQRGRHLRRCPWPQRSLVREPGGDDPLPSGSDEERVTHQCGAEGGQYAPLPALRPGVYSPWCEPTHVAAPEFLPAPLLHPRTVGADHLPGPCGADDWGPLGEGGQRLYPLVRWWNGLRCDLFRVGWEQEGHNDQNETIGW